MTHHNTDYEQLARFGEQPPLEALPTDDAPPAPYFLWAFLAIVGLFVTVAFAAFFWGRV